MNTSKTITASLSLAVILSGLILSSTIVSADTEVIDQVRCLFGS